MQYDLIAYFTLNKDLWSEKSHSESAPFQSKPFKNDGAQRIWWIWNDLDDFHTLDKPFKMKYTFENHFCLRKPLKTK